MASDQDKAARKQILAEFLAILRVFVDDFMGGLAVPPEQESDSIRERFARAVLHSIHAVFPPPEVSGHKGGKDSVSVKKLIKGDGRFDTTKELLGFNFMGDPGAGRMIALPQKKFEAYSQAIRTALDAPRHYIGFRTFQSIYGKLQHASTVFPAVKSFMTPLNRALKKGNINVGLGKKSEIRETFLRMLDLLQLAVKRPCHITELVPTALPHVYGYMDAAAVGAGGVRLPCTEFMPAIVWRIPFPDDIRKAVQEQKGITNSDLEFAAYLIQNWETEVWFPNGPVGLVTWDGSDNSPTVGWENRKASRSLSRFPERGLQLDAMRSLHTRRGPGHLDHVAGKSNTMADFASRSYEEGFPPSADDQFLTEFSRRHPLPPQLGSWKLVHP